MTVKSAMNDCSSQNHSSLWSPCCGGWNSARSSFDNDGGLTTNTGAVNATYLRPQSSPSSGQQQQVNCHHRHQRADVAVAAAEQLLRLRRRSLVVSPSELYVRRSLPRPAEACTTRQFAVVSHTVHSREINKPLPQLAVAPPPTSSILPRSAPPRRRRIPDVREGSNCNSLSVSKATQTTAAASRILNHQTSTVDELLASRQGLVDIDDYHVAVPTHLSRPCSMPRMSDAAALNRVESALVNELVERGRHASLERFADTTDSAGALELLSRFQSSATFPGFSHVNVEVDGTVDGQRQPRSVFRNNSEIISGTNDGHDVYDVFAAGTEHEHLSSDGFVRWTIAETSVPHQVCQNPPGDGEDAYNELFFDGFRSNDDACAAGSSTSSVVGCRQSSSDSGAALMACSSGRYMTSTPMTPLAARSRVDEDCLQQRTVAWQRSASHSDDDADDLGTKQVRECSRETRTHNSADAEAHVDVSQRQRRVVMYYPPQAFKFYIEQHMENVMKAYEERQRHRAQLEDEMERLALPDEARTQMRRMLFQKESYHNRLRRTQMDRTAFRPIAVLGRGAFADVMLVRKRDTGALYAMKRLRKSDVLRNRQAAHVKAERDILAEADNEWIVRLFYSFQVDVSCA